MSSGPGHSRSFVQRWLSRPSDKSRNTSHSSSDAASSSTSTGAFSPPPLTDSSSTYASSRGLQTPKDSPISFHHKLNLARPDAAKSARAPSTKHETALIPHRKPSNHLPSIPERSTELVIRQPPIKLHRLLSYDPMHDSLIYDVSSPPSYIRQTPPQTANIPSNPIPSYALIPYSGRPPQPRFSHRIPYPPAPVPRPAPIPDDKLSQYATTPPVTHLKIISDIIPWPIHVRGQYNLSDGSKSYITVMDVLDTIYHSSRTGVTEQEWRGRPRPFRDRVKRAFHERCARSRAYSLEGYEEKQGVRRVDWFLEKTMFLGLMIKAADRQGAGRTHSADEITWVMMMGPR